MQTLFSKVFVVIGCVVLGFSCKKEANLVTVFGTETAIGKGTARTFLTVNNAGVPNELGVAFTAEALSGLPGTNTTYVLQLHQRAIDVVPFKHVVVGLSAAGHGLPPSGHIEAHFDVRFFLMSNEEREAIPTPAAPLIPPAGAGFDEVPPAGYLPENYVMNYAVAKIGRHWASNTFPSGAHVDHAMIYGTYNGVLTFIAPIVTVAHLATGGNVSVNYPQPQKFSQKGHYAKKYNFRKDDKGNYMVTLSDFVKR